MTDLDLIQRPRRNRRTQRLRDLVAETTVEPRQLVMPHFVLPSQDGREPIPSMPGIERLGCDPLLHQLESDLALGIGTVLLFGLPAAEHKAPDAHAATDDDGPFAKTLRAIKERFGDDLLVATDVCLCSFTDHGHCGVLTEEGIVDNDASLDILARTARTHARAGADIVAPSDMMDGRVAAIRTLLDEDGHQEIGILSYAVKYASAFYGPFRDAADSAPQSGDRKSYQMDPRNALEALREVELDEVEGADMVMVKPGLPYLDVIRAVSEATDLPVAAYNVSGEFSALKAAAERGWLDEPAVVRETLIALRRAGAQILITYHARDVLEGGWL